MAKKYQLCTYGELYNDPCEGEVYLCGRGHELCSIHLIRDENLDFEHYYCPICGEDEIETWVKPRNSIGVISGF